LALRKTNKKKTPEFKKPFIVLNRRKVFGWSIVIFFLCAWMFVLGVLVGRDSAPVKFDIAKLQQKLERPDSETLKKEEEKTSKEPAAVRDKTKLEFYEALPEDRSDTTIPDIEKPDVVSKKIESAPKKNDTGSEKKDQSSQGAGTDAAQPDKAAVQSKAEPSGKIYTVQVAAFKNPEDADKFIAKLKAKGFPAYRAIGKISGQGIWFRVRTGEYKSRVQARSTLEKLKKFGMKPILVEKK